MRVFILVFVGIGSTLDLAIGAVSDLLTDLVSDLLGLADFPLAESSIEVAEFLLADVIRPLFSGPRVPPIFKTGAVENVVFEVLNLCKALFPFCL